MEGILLRTKYEIVIFLRKIKNPEIWSNKTDVDVWHWGFLPLEDAQEECSIYRPLHSSSFIKEPATSSQGLSEGGFIFMNENW